MSRAYLNSTKLIIIAKKYYNCDKIDSIQLEEGVEMELLGRIGKKEFY